jgi:hypothetical protein
MRQHCLPMSEGLGATAVSGWCDKVCIVIFEHLTLSTAHTNWSGDVARVVLVPMHAADMPVQQQFTVQGEVVRSECEYKYIELMYGTGRVLLSTKLEKTGACRGAAAHRLRCMQCSMSLQIQSFNPYLKMQLSVTWKSVSHKSMVCPSTPFYRNQCWL